MKHTIQLILETDIAEDIRSDCTIEVNTVVDIAIGEKGYVGTILSIQEVPAMPEEFLEPPADPDKPFYVSTTDWQERKKGYGDRYSNPCLTAPEESPGTNDTPTRSILLEGGQ
mgnify:CR=1 FL=1